MSNEQNEDDWESAEANLKALDLVSHHSNVNYICETLVCIDYLLKTNYYIRLTERKSCTKTSFETTNEHGKQFHEWWWFE